MYEKQRRYTLGFYSSDSVAPLFAVNLQAIIFRAASRMGLVRHLEFPDESVSVKSHFPRI